VNAASPRLPLEVRVAGSPEAAAQAVASATRAFGAGDRAAAERDYRDALARDFAHPRSWSNLAALGIALDDAVAARGHAQRALAMDRGHADAWVNLGVACWHGGQRREAARATRQALALAPGMESAALNYSLMLRAVGQPAAARQTLAAALVCNPGSARLQQTMAELSRLLGDTEATRTHALSALALLTPGLNPDAGAAPSPGPSHPPAGAGVATTLLAVHDALGAAGLGFHLVGGTLLALWRDGHLLPHDKDVDLGLWHETGRDAVAAAFSEGFRPSAPAGSPAMADSRQWVMGYVHEATGIGVDLFFMQRRGALIHNKVGWPDDLASEVPAYALQALRWQGRDWQVPSPPEQYLQCMYGTAWRTPIRHYDTQLSSPATTAECLPRAINLSLLRLLAALRQQHWDKAVSLCGQLLAREALAEVQAIQARLLASGPG
jgi:tetratricopeptide (TPR) repeat protein